MTTLMPGHAPLKFHPLANLFPMLDEASRASFRASLAEKQNNPIWLHRGMILDGRNRYRELVELGKPVNYRLFEGTDRQAFDFVMAENLERRHLSESQRSMVAAKAATLRLGDNQHTAQAAPIGAPTLNFEGAQWTADEVKAFSSERPPIVSQSEAADMLNVGRRSVQRATVVQEKGATELQQAVEQGKIAVSTAAEIADALPKEEQAEIAKLSDEEILAKAKTIRKEKNDKRRTERVEKIKQKAAGNTELSTVRKFPVIYMDPPTKFAAGDSDRSTENHYPTMTEEEIAALPISDLATDDAVLFIWTTVPWLRKTIRLIEGWGFEYVSEFVWDKEHMSLGFWNRNVHESLLIATRGKIPAPDPSVLERSLYSEARTRHSAKPAKYREIITAYYPELPKVELFPRGTLPDGWHGWGNEARLTEQQTLGIDSDEKTEEQAA